MPSCTVSGVSAPANGTLVGAACVDGAEMPSDGGTWPQLPLRHCASGGHYIASYDTQAEAQAACAADSSCLAIYDSDCNDVGEWKTCLTTDTVSSVSCLYMKTPPACDVTCDSGFVLRGTLPSCWNGTFDPGTFWCEQQCTVTGLSAPSNGALDAACADGAALESGSSCTLVCDAGYTVTGVQPSCVGSSFDAGSVSCAENECTALSAVPEAYSVENASATTVSGLGAVACAAGYNGSIVLPACPVNALFPLACPGVKTAI